MDHGEFLVLIFSRKNFERDSLKIVSEERHVLRTVAAVWPPVLVDELDAALLDDVKGPLAGYAVLRCRAGEADDRFASSSACRPAAAFRR